MSLLDDLKNQSESILSRQRSAEEDLNARVETAHARLKDALHYWVQFANSLNVIKPEVRRSYFIEGTSQLEDLLQADYNVNGRRRTIDHRDYIEAVVVSYRCASPTPLVIEKDSATLVDRLRDHLWSHGLKFDLKEMRRDGAYVERGRFVITPEISVEITMAADIDNSQVRLTVRNLERLGEYTNAYDYDEFSPDLLEEIGKAILAHPHRLRVTGRAQLRAATHLRSVPKSA